MIRRPPRSTLPYTTLFRSLLGTLPDELLLEPVGEFEHLPVPVRKRLLPDDGDETADVLSFRVRRVELVRDLLVVLARPVFPDPGVHEPGQGGERINRREADLAVGCSADLLSDFTDGMGPS